MYISVLKHVVIEMDWGAQTGWLRYNINGKYLSGNDMELFAFLVEFENISTLRFRMFRFPADYGRKKGLSEIIKEKIKLLPIDANGPGRPYYENT